MNGYTGKILRINLTDKKASTIETEKYMKWIGGHGIGSAIFFDLVRDKTIDGFNPRNVVTIMTSPLTGTMTPGGASRTEIQGIGVQTYPLGWFTRSNIGGRFGPMLKYAGWDGLVIEGKAGHPVWIDIRNQNVRFRDAEGLWGLDTWESQKKIWKLVQDNPISGSWSEIGEGEACGRTTQRPAVMAIGPAGENLGRIAAIIHDAGNASGQGGFGGIWGAKNLKAISVIGTGGVEVNDPFELLEARAWAKKNYMFNIEDPSKIDAEHSLLGDPTVRSAMSMAASPLPIVFWHRRKESRPQACIGCPAGCRARNDTGLGNESACAETIIYAYPDMKKQSRLWVRIACSIIETAFDENAASFFALSYGESSDIAYAATDLCQKLGINAYEVWRGIPYLRALHKKGVLGPGRQIDCTLPFERFGEFAFFEELLTQMAYRKGIGADLAEGLVRASEKWGRLEDDLTSGLLPCPYWGMPDHYDPRYQVEWGYGSILGDRDINEHDFNLLYWMPTIASLKGEDPRVSAEEVSQIFSRKMIPFENDQKMLDYSDENIYSEHFVKLVAWHRYYTRFWKQSALYCDFLFPDFLNLQTKDKQGMLGKGEQRFLNAVTGKSMDFRDGIDLGRKIWNLDNAIWTLQGRHRDMVHFAPYVYKRSLEPSAYMPGMEDGKWKYINVEGRYLDKKKFDEWKTLYYEFEGWDPQTGWPTRKTLEFLDLKEVADELEEKGRVGKESS